jgi:PTH1 family peptidyl-tRNA hydrolase
MWLVVGLGNPGTQYQGNRHNLGFMVVDELVRRCRAPSPRAKFGAALTEGELAGERVLFCKPMEFMNVSGQTVARVAQFWKVAPASTIAVHDEIDLPFGRLKLGAGGGHGGHNGVRSLIADWGTADFHRVRIGVGRPSAGHDVAGYLLSDFSRDEQGEIPALVNDAADAVEVLIKSGLTAAMNKFNARKKS